jgi:hypothetical protein
MCGLLVQLCWLLQRWRLLLACRASGGRGGAGATAQLLSQVPLAMTGRQAK